MSDLRTAAQQALEALELIDKEFKKHGRQHWPEAVKARNTAPALRAALAEPVQEAVQEPVAWRWGYRSITTGEMDWRGYVEIAADPNLRSPAIIMQPLYTAPPQRKPLTEEMLRQIRERRIAPDWRGAFIDGWIGAEQAHGIRSTR